MRATWPLILTLAVALAGGCARQEAEAPPAAEPRTDGAHPAINKLVETKKDMGAIEAQRKEQQRAAEGGEAP